MEKLFEQNISNIVREIWVNKNNQSFSKVYLKKVESYKMIVEPFGWDVINGQIYIYNYDNRNIKIKEISLEELETMDEGERCSIYKFNYEQKVYKPWRILKKGCLNFDYKNIFKKGVINLNVHKITKENKKIKIYLKY